MWNDPVQVASTQSRYCPVVDGDVREGLLSCQACLDPPAIRLQFSDIKTGRLYAREYSANSMCINPVDIHTWFKQMNLSASVSDQACICILYA